MGGWGIILCYMGNCKGNKTTESGYLSGKLTNTDNSLNYSNGHLWSGRVSWFIPWWHASFLLILPQARDWISTRAAETNLKKENKEWQEASSVGSIKYHFIFYESCPRLLHWQLVFSISCNGMFAQSLTFLSYNSLMLRKYPHINAVINFLSIAVDLLT